MNSVSESTIWSGNSGEPDDAVAPFVHRETSRYQRHERTNRVLRRLVGGLALSWELRAKAPRELPQTHH